MISSLNLNDCIKYTCSNGSFPPKVVGSGCPIGLQKLGAAPIAFNCLEPVQSDCREQIYFKIIWCEWSIKATAPVVLWNTTQITSCFWHVQQIEFSQIIDDSHAEHIYRRNFWEFIHSFGDCIVNGKRIKVLNDYIDNSKSKSLNEPKISPVDCHMRTKRKLIPQAVYASKMGRLHKHHHAKNGVTQTRPDF